MLEAGVLCAELQRFADPVAGMFEAWPRGRVDARHHWAHAFFVYVGHMVDTSPALTPTGGTLVFSSVEQAFFESITFVNADIASAATDFADAWRAGIGALLPGPSATSGGSTFTYAAMDSNDVDTRYTALRTDLVAALTTARGSRRADLAELADAFHRATHGLRSTATTIVVTYG